MEVHMVPALDLERIFQLQYLAFLGECDLPA